MHKGRKLAGKVKGERGRWVKERCVRNWEMMLKMLVATIWRRYGDDVPGKKLSHGKTDASQKRWMGERGHLTVKFHVIGDSSPHWQNLLAIPADSSRFQPLPMNTLLKQEGLQPETSFRHGPNFKDRNIVAGPDGPKSVDSKQLAQFG